MITTWVRIAALLAVLALVAGLVKACQSRDEGLIKQGRTEQKAVDQEAADKIKADAAKALADETALVRAAEDRALALKQSLEVAREKAQSANRDAVAARAAGQRLRFVAEATSRRCGRGGGGAKAESDTATSDPGPAIVELPESVNRRLWDLAGKAESLAIDYRVLYEWANTPGMVCTVPAPGYELQPQATSGLKLK